MCVRSCVFRFALLPGLIFLAKYLAAKVSYLAAREVDLAAHGLHLAAQETHFAAEGWLLTALAQYWVTQGSYSAKWGSHFVAQVLF